MPPLPCRSLLIVAGLIALLTAFTPRATAQKPATPAPAAAQAAAELKRGEQVRTTRAQMLFFYGKPHHMAKKGEQFEVLDARANQVFVAVKDGERVVAMSLPLDAIVPLRRVKENNRIEESTALFAGLIPTLNLRIDPKGIEALRKEPRSYVECTIEEASGVLFKNVAVKLKGSAGSFQGIDARPGFSINCSKYKGGDRFHGLKRFQLNNCAQDGSALSELVAGEMARLAGVPASRCTHALVSLNGRELGIYVLKEGFTEEFLAAFFRNTDGQLYDGGFCQEINENMELDRGDAKKKERLLELVGAMREGDATKQWERLAAVVDVEAYLRYLALENIMCHWDGYSFNRNNYRIYENPETGKFHFILHGMDQMFSDANWSIQRDPGAQLGSIIWRRPEARERYYQILADIGEKVLKPIDWPARVEEHARRLATALEAKNPDQARDYAQRASGMTRQVEARVAGVRRQLEAPRVENTLLTKGVAELKGGAWNPQVTNGESREADEDGKKCLYLKATGEANASWRLGQPVPSGKYRFEARVKARGIDPLETESGDGAGLRISGGNRKGQKFLKGDAPWEVLSYEFESGGGDVALVVELRAKAGELWIDRDSLRIVRVP